MSANRELRGKMTLEFGTVAIGDKPSVALLGDRDQTGKSVFAHVFDFVFSASERETFSGPTIAQGGFLNDRMMKPTPLMIKSTSAKFIPRR